MFDVCIIIIGDKSIFCFKKIESSFLIALCIFLFFFFGSREQETVLKSSCQTEVKLIEFHNCFSLLLSKVYLKIGPKNMEDFLF